MHKFDEMYAQQPYSAAHVRPHYRRYLEWLDRQQESTMRARRDEAEIEQRRQQ
mgnify:FL=1